MSAKLSLLFLLVVTPALLAEKVTEIVAEIGSKGTDDDVAVVLGSQTSSGKVTTCTTPILNSYANDWSRGDTEEWDEGYIGGCFGFEVNGGLAAGLAKNGNDGLEVVELTVKTDEGSYKCGSFKLTDDGVSTQSNYCVKA